MSGFVKLVKVRQQDLAKGRDSRKAMSFQRVSSLTPKGQARGFFCPVGRRKSGWLSL